MKRVMFFIACAILVTSCATGSFVSTTPKAKNDTSTKTIQCYYSTEARQGLRGDRPRGGKRLYLHLEQAARLCFAEAGAEAAGGRHRERPFLLHSRPIDRDSVRGRGLGEA